MNRRADIPQKITAIQPTLPKGGGAIQGLGETFSQNEFTGTAALSIPIELTPSRDFTPQLSVDYTSGNGSGIFGLGFELSLPNIVRQTSKGIPQYMGTDTFLFSGSDYLVPDDNTPSKVVGDYQVTRYLSRTEDEFDRIEHWVSSDGYSYWKVVTRQNLTSIFGRSEQARIAAPEQNTHIFKWLLEESFDAKGNHIQYHWEGEDSAALPTPIYEQHRAPNPNKYLARIEYGNQDPISEAISLQSQPIPTTWHFEVVIDYSGQVAFSGEDIYQKVLDSTPTLRPDPFSVYHAGFEIRTRRLGYHILLFHRFPEKEYGTKQPALVRAWQFTYNHQDIEEARIVSLLQEVQEVGYSFQKGNYHHQALPALTFEYSTFPKGIHAFGDLQMKDGDELVGVDHFPFQLVDLHSEGIPGILYNDGTSVLYQEPLGVKAGTTQGEFEPFEVIPHFPISRETGGRTHTLIDVTGNGQLDLLESSPMQAGYYAQKPDGSWKDFQTLPGFPTDFHDPLFKPVDVTGEGLTDLLIIEEERVRVYPNQRTQGYGQALLTERRPDLPLSKLDAPTLSLRFADMAGAGTPQLVRIQKDRVVYWPSLGYGKFAPPVTMENPPSFGDDFDTTRLFLVDADGSGTSDLVYLYPDKVKLFRNQSGNRFAAPIEISLPTPWDQLDQVQFTDLFGRGTSCLVFTQLHPTPQHWYYDFSSNQKPYLLTHLSNNMGGQTEIQYASSTKFYLEDKKAGNFWVTRLPFPVQVIEKVIQRDLISNTRLTHTYRYRHGYYDGTEREFRGFGYVERQDAEELIDLILEQDAPPSPYYVPPVRHKTWYHVGAWLKETDLLEEYKKEYFKGDSQALTLPNTLFEPADMEGDALREAHRSLQGTILRTEIYGLDKSQWESVPYRVTENRYKVQQIQAKGTHKYSVCLVHDLESLQSEYERNPNDPQTSHHLVLETDTYGHVLQSCEVTYGRRSNHGAGLAPSTRSQQTQLRILSTQNAWINQDEETRYLLGVPVERKDYEIRKLTPAHGQYFTFEELYEKIVHQFSSLDTQLRQWGRYYYCEANQTNPLPLGTVTPQILLHSVRLAELDKQITIAAFQGILTPSQIEQSLTGTDSDGGGYVTFSQGDASEFFWNPGSYHTYHDASQFYLVKTVTDPFGNPLHYHYDDYHLLVKKVIDSSENTTEMTRINYQHVSPEAIQDMNGNTSEVLLDPLGMVSVSSYYGTEGGQTCGFDSLFAPGREWPRPASVQDLIDHPNTYLKGAAHYFYYDLTSTPAFRINLVAEDYPHDGMPGGPIQTILQYSDGFGRELQSKLKAEDAAQGYWETGRDGHDQKVSPQDIWLTTGAVRYNNKDLVVRKYEPFFTDKYTYTDQEALQKLGVSPTLFYDPLGRLVLTEYPKGFRSKTLYGELTPEPPLPVTNSQGFLAHQLYGGLTERFTPSPWTILFFDRNNTLTETEYYENRDQLAHWEKVAAEKTAPFANQPQVQLLDNLARVIQTYRYGMVGSSNYVMLDLMGFQQWSADERLLNGGYHNFEYTHTLSGDSIKTISVDAGTHWRLFSTMQRVIYTRDSRNFVIQYHYDDLQRLIQKKVTGGDGAPLNEVVEYLFYGDTKLNGVLIFENPETWNNRGKQVALFDQAGLNFNACHSITGRMLRESRVCGKRDLEVLNWNIFNTNDSSVVIAALKALQKKFTPSTPNS